MIRYGACVHLSLPPVGSQKKAQRTDTYGSHLTLLGASSVSQLMQLLPAEGLSSRKEVVTSKKVRWLRHVCGVHRA